MLKKILLNEKELHFSKRSLPLLIHGDDGHGASLFSVSVISDLYAQGTNLIFLCGYTMARDEFENQTQSSDESVLFDGSTDLSSTNKRVIFIPSQHPELIGRVLESLDDSADRVVFFKNFDLFDEIIYSLVKDLPNLVMMGDIDKCSYANELLKKKWVSQLYFTVPKSGAIEMPKLEKYKGYLKSNHIEGIASLVE